MKFNQNELFSIFKSENFLREFKTLRNAGKFWVGIWGDANYSTVAIYVMKFVEKIIRNSSARSICWQSKFGDMCFQNFSNNRYQVKIFSHITITVRFTKVNELKLIQVELFSFFHFMCAAVNASELFCMAYLAKMNAFYTILTFHFKYQFLYVCKLACLSWWISTQASEVSFF